MIQRTREEIVGELLKAYSTREPVEPLTGRYDGLTAVGFVLPALELIDSRTAGGRK